MGMRNELRWFLALLAVAAMVTSGCASRPVPANVPCHVVMSAPVSGVEWDAQCSIERLGFPSELTLTLPDQTWLTVAYAPSAHTPLLSFSAGWGRGDWRCAGLREPASWASAVEGKDTTVFTIALFCADEPEHAIALAATYPN